MLKRGAVRIYPSRDGIFTFVLNVGLLWWLRSLRHVSRASYTCMSAVEGKKICPSKAYTALN